MTAVFRRLLSAVAAAALLVPLASAAYTSPGNPDGWVNDFAGVLDDAEEAAIEARLEAYHSTSGNEVAVVTVSSLGGDTIESVAEKLFREWGIGSEAEDNGVLILVAPVERQVRIEVGYGLEGSLTDAQSSWIIREELAPRFREGQYAEGVNAAVERIVAAADGTAPVPEETSGDAGGWAWLAWLLVFAAVEIMASTKSWWLGGVLGAVGGVVTGIAWGWMAGIAAGAVFVAIGLAVDYVLSKRAGSHSGRSGWWGGAGGSSGGGWGGFGGGSSGGGGASGDW